MVTLIGKKLKRLELVILYLNSIFTPYAVCISKFFMGPFVVSNTYHYTPLLLQEIQEGILHQCAFSEGSQRGDQFAK